MLTCYLGQAWHSLDCSLFKVHSNLPFLSNKRSPCGCPANVGGAQGMLPSPSISEAASLALERQFDGKNRDLNVNTSSLQNRRSGV